MGFFDKLKAGMGIGGAKLEIVLEPGVIAPGGLARGRVILQGGKLEQQSNGITVLLVRRWRTTGVDEAGTEETGHKETLGSYLLSGSTFAIAPGEARELLFEIPVPTDVSAESTLEIGATADIPGAIDPKAAAALDIDWEGAPEVTSEYEELAAAPYEDDSGPNQLFLDPAKRSVMLVRSDELEFFDTTSGDYQHGWEAEDLISASFAPGGGQVLTGDRDGVVKLRDGLSGEVLAESEPLSDDFVRHLCPLGQSAAFVATTDDGAVAILAHPGLERRQTLQSGGDDEARGLAVSPDGGRVFVSKLYSVCAYDVTSGELLWEQDDLPAPNGANLEVSPDGRWVAAALSGWGICWLDAGSGAVGPSHAFSCQSGVHWPGMIGDASTWSANPRFSPDGRRLAVNNTVGDLLVLDGATAALIWEFERSKGLSWISDLAWLDDGRLLLGHTHRRFTIWTLDPLNWEIDTEL